MTEERSKGRKVCYYYDGDVGNYYYGQGNVHIKKIFHKVFENYTPASRCLSKYEWKFIISNNLLLIYFSNLVKHI